jgi:hypothetical protein
MVCVPDVNIEVSRVLSGAGIAAPPSIWKVTPPVAPGGSVALIATNCPVREGFSEDARLTLPVAWFTVWVKLEEAVPKSVSPGKDTVMVCEPAVRLEVSRVLSGAGIAGPPSTWKVTPPVAPGGSVALIATGCPYVEGFNEDARLTLPVAWFTVWVRLAEANP